jgi:hypothetical protein
MSKILILHGISNQYSGPAQLHAGWFPPLCDGLRLAGYPSGPEPADCVCPFYGALFRPRGALGSQSEVDLRNVSSDEARLLEEIWRAAAKADDQVPAPQEFGNTLVYAPEIVSRALAALAKSKYLSDSMPLEFFGDLRQVVLYLNDRVIREKILDHVLPHITSDTRVVVGHSLGSVIAYEAVALKPEGVSELVTLGSPLGIRNIVFDKLTPPPDPRGIGRWPGRVANWTNIAARGDIVAAEKRLAPLFGERLKDVFVDSGWDAHSSVRYLDSVEAGRAIALGLA